MPHFDKLASDASLLMGNYPDQPEPCFAPYQTAVWLLVEPAMALAPDTHRTDRSRPVQGRAG